MKRTTNINLGGFAFTIDNDAYDVLSGYVKDIESRLTEKEAIVDIESRIAEIFRENLSVDIYVVNLALVHKTISMMGDPDNFGSRKYIPPIPKKLMRDPDHQVIGGICSGLAAYFRTDISLMRVIMLLLVIPGGMSIWVYIILWIVIPVAKTPQEKAMLRESSDRPF